MDPITNPNFVPTFNPNQFQTVSASPGDLGGLFQSIVGMGNQSQAWIEALARGEMPSELTSGVEAMGISIPRPPNMQLFMEYTNLQTAQSQEESALGDRIKNNTESLVEAFYRTHHLEFNNGQPRVADPPPTATASAVDTVGPANELASSTAANTQAAQAYSQAQAAQSTARTNLASATASAEAAHARAETLAAAAASDPNGIVPNSNPPVTNSEAATRAAADAAAADARVQETQQAAVAAEAAAVQAQQAAAAAQAQQAAAQATLTAAQQQAQIEANTAEIQNLQNQIGAQETFEQRSQRQEWEASQEAAARASFEPEKAALQARQQQMLAQVQQNGRQDPELMEQLQREEADLNIRIEKAVILATLPPGASTAPPNSELGQLYAQVQSDFAEYDNLRTSNRAELESSEAGREIRRFLAESRAFTASLPTREQAFDPNAMRNFARRMGLEDSVFQAPVVDLGAPTVEGNPDFLGDAGIQLPPGV